MLNEITIMGRLTRDPELRTTTSGISCATFSLAVERDFKEKSGDKATDFIDVVAWRSTADFVSKYFAKGRMAVVHGRLQIDSYKDKDGNPRRAARVVADNIYFGDAKPVSQSSQSSAVPAAQPVNVMPEASGLDDDEDLPF